MKGSLNDIEVEMGEEVAEWKAECGRNEDWVGSREYLRGKAALLSLFYTRSPNQDTSKSSEGRNTTRANNHTKANANDSVQNGKVGLMKPRQGKAKEINELGIKQGVKHSFAEAMESRDWRTR